MLLFMILLQERRISWFVIIAAVLVLIAGISLVVYFYRRYKRIEKETENEWDASRSLFLHPSIPATREHSGAPEPAEITEATPEKPLAPQSATREFASASDLPSIQPRPPVPEVEPVSPVAEVEPSRPAEAGATQILASPAPIKREEAPAKTEEPPAAVFDEEIWQGLDVAEQPERIEPEPSRSARVEAPPHREPFEPPSIEAIKNREPYEPPRIAALTPREQEVTRALHSIKPESDQPASDRTGQTGLIGSVLPKPVSDALQEPRRPAETLEFAAAVPTRDHTEASTVAGSSYRSRLAPAGSILGLPFESSSQPLVLGKPVRPAEEEGIGGLTHYGEDTGPKSGHAGTIILVAVLLLLAGGALAYLVVPSVHSRFDNLVARIRGVDAQNSPAALKPKAQVIPSFRPEVNKNMVIARGAVDNISDEPLENLEIEVSLQPGANAPPEVRRIAITPSVIQPNERGNFEFEYDGKRDTGFASYTITRLYSNGKEVKFKSPYQGVGESR